MVRDYNYDCMMAYRSSLRSSMTVAVSAVRHVERLERELLRLRYASTNIEISPDITPLLAHFDWALLCSHLLSSLRSL